MSRPASRPATLAPLPLPVATPSSSSYTRNNNSSTQPWSSSSGGGTRSPARTASVYARTTAAATASPTKTRALTADSGTQQYTRDDTSIRTRDLYVPELGKAERPPSPPQTLTLWEQTRSTEMQPWQAQSTGFTGSRSMSFGDRTERSDKHETYQDYRRNQKHYIPGYTGFVRGKQHIAGRTYGQLTERALNSDYRELVEAGAIPSHPHENRKIPQNTPEDSFITHQFAGKSYHLPGYTGFVPATREAYAQTYGRTTERVMQHNDWVQESDGFASTAFARNFHPVHPNPLPGGATTHKPPQKYVPAHLRNLRYI